MADHRDSHPIDFEGVLLLPDLCRVLKTSEATIRRRLRNGVFPIPVLSGIDERGLRWSGPVVRRFLDAGGEVTTPGRRPRRPRADRRRRDDAA